VPQQRRKLKGKRGEFQARLDSTLPSAQHSGSTPAIEAAFDQPAPWLSQQRNRSLRRHRMPPSVMQPSISCALVHEPTSKAWNIPASQGHPPCFPARMEAWAVALPIITAARFPRPPWPAVTSFRSVTPCPLELRRFEVAYVSAASNRYSRK